MTPFPYRMAVATLMGVLRGPEIVFALRRLGPKWLTVVNYHRIDEPCAAADVDMGVLSATPEAFERQMGVLGTHFNPNRPEGSPEHLDGRELPANPVLVAFGCGILPLPLALPGVQRRNDPSSSGS